MLQVFVLHTKQRRASQVVGLCRQGGCKIELSLGEQAAAPPRSARRRHSQPLATVCHEAEINNTILLYYIILNIVPGTNPGHGAYRKSRHLVGAVAHQGGQSSVPICVVVRLCVLRRRQASDSCRQVRKQDGHALQLYGGIILYYT